ncbi:DUF1659 domain-containing protein [Clostridium sp. JNZ J1-5]|nr:DUF1659 domain-containing protein [Clostridium sp.]
MINSTGIKSTLVVKYLAGQDKNGKDLFKSQRFANVKTTAKDEDLFAVAKALGNLLENPNVEVMRENDSLIVNE